MSTLLREARGTGTLAITFEASLGGVPRSQVTLANALLRRGRRPAFVLPSRRAVTLDGLAAGVERIDLEAAGRVSYILGLARYLRHAPPDAVLVSQPLAGVALAVACRLGRFHGPVVLTIHNDPSSAIEKGLTGRLAVLVMRRAYRRVDALVGVSEGVVEDLRRLFPGLREKIHRVANGLEIAEVRRQAQQQPCGERWLDAKEEPVFVAVGRLVPQKDLATTIRALSRYRETLPGRLVIVGEGPERGGLEALTRRLGMQDAVRLVGYQANPYRFMARADALVASSRWEGFGLAVLEALALGLPVVATDCRSGPKEILERGRHGILVPVGDVEALARAMAQAVADGAPGDAASRMRRAADFSAEAAADRYLDLLALGGRQGSVIGPLAP